MGMLILLFLQLGFAGELPQVSQAVGGGGKQQCRRSAPAAAESSIRVQVVTGSLAAGAVGDREWRDATDWSKGRGDT